MIQEERNKWVSRLLLHHEERGHYYEEIQVGVWRWVRDELMRLADVLCGTGGY